MLHLNPVADEEKDARGPQVTAACTEEQGSTLADSLKVSRLTPRDILIIPPIDNEASQHFFRPLRSPCLSNLHWPRRSAAAQHYHLSHFTNGQMNWGREATARSCCRSTAESQSNSGDTTLAPRLWAPHAAYLTFTSLQCRGGEMTPSGLGQNTFGLVLSQRWDRSG